MFSLVNYHYIFLETTCFHCKFQGWKRTAEISECSVSYSLNNLNRGRRSLLPQLEDHHPFLFEHLKLLCCLVDWSFVVMRKVEKVQLEVNTSASTRWRRLFYLRVVLCYLSVVEQHTKGHLMLIMTLTQSSLCFLMEPVGRKDMC